MSSVLLVDDEYLVREALRTILHGFPGYSVIGETGNGKEAVQLAATLSPDIVFMDIMLYGIDGLEASQLIKKANSNVTIVIITACHDFEFAKRAMDIGIKHYLLKPFSLHEIREILIWHKENHLNKPSRLDLLIKELASQSFEQACDSIPEIAGQIFQDTREADERYRQFSKLLVRLLKQNHGAEKYVKKLENFVIDDAVCNDERQAEFWLFDVMDEAFKRQGIQACPSLEKVFAYIDMNINNEISLYSAAAYAGLSVSYLSRIFKKRFGTNFAKYVSLKKIKRSKQILKYSQMTINDIAFELGYNEVNYFCKVFKKSEHITPSQYRESLRSSM